MASKFFHKQYSINRFNESNQTHSSFTAISKLFLYIFHSALMLLAAASFSPLTAGAPSEVLPMD